MRCQKPWRILLARVWVSRKVCAVAGPVLSRSSPMNSSLSFSSLCTNWKVGNRNACVCRKQVGLLHPATCLRHQYTASREPEDVPGHGTESWVPFIAASTSRPQTAPASRGWRLKRRAPAIPKAQARSKGWTCARGHTPLLSTASRSRPKC